VDRLETVSDATHYEFVYSDNSFNANSEPHSFLAQVYEFHICVKHVGSLAAKYISWYTMGNLVCQLDVYRYMCKGTVSVVHWTSCQCINCPCRNCPVSVSIGSIVLEPFENRLMSPEKEFLSYIMDWCFELMFMDRLCITHM